MNEQEYTDLRIGDADREAAVAALGDHLSAGRLTIDEYGERTAKATSARTYAQLLDLFTDLPSPHPAPAADVLKPAAETPLVPTATAVPVPVRGGRLAPRIVRGLGWISGMVWFILLVTGHPQFWWLIFVPAIFYVFASQVWPTEADEQRRRRCSGADLDEETPHGRLT
jgi:hypothetical protein